MLQYNIRLQTDPTTSPPSIPSPVSVVHTVRSTPLSAVQSFQRAAAAASSPPPSDHHPLPTNLAPYFSRAPPRLMNTKFLSAERVLSHPTPPLLSRRGRIRNEFSCLRHLRRGLRLFSPLPSLRTARRLLFRNFLPPPPLSYGPFWPSLTAAAEKEEDKTKRERVRLPPSLA